MFVYTWDEWEVNRGSWAGRRDAGERVEEGLTAGKDAGNKPGTGTASGHGPAPVGVGVLPGELGHSAQVVAHLISEHKVVGNEYACQGNPAAQNSLISPIHLSSSPFLAGDNAEQHV